MSSLKLYLKFETLFSTMLGKSQDALVHIANGNMDAAEKCKGYLEQDYEQLKIIIQDSVKEFPPKNNLRRHISWGQEQDFNDIIKHDIPEFKKWLMDKILEGEIKEPVGFENLLHPLIRKISMPYYHDENLRDAVLNGITALFDFIRSKSGIKKDGEALINAVFALSDPILVFTEIASESGKSDQIGFFEILKGAYKGIRNVKAHTLSHDLNAVKAAQYLVFLSILARRVEEAIKVK